ncbi:MAG: TIGR02530 family flagellar biosynthesis protein [Candidatus Hydrogenedentes bacterium]|nr:TIGR02530 family flagellar biosynthesis protein [Candidatus Hydrogenedentota bacterium]
MINKIDLYTRTGPEVRGAPTARQPATPFAGVLADQVRGATNVKFSAHAAQRLTDRHITVTQHDEARIARAVDKAAAKGSRETLLLMEKMALVVSVPNRTVITAVSRNEFADTVFTNIDSAVLVDQR